MRDNPKIFFKSEKKSKKNFSNRNGLGNHSQTVLIIKSEKNYNCKISIKCLNPQILCYKSETSLKIKELLSNPEKYFGNHKTYFIKRYLHQQSSSVRSFPHYLPFQNGG